MEWFLNTSRTFKVILVLIILTLVFALPSTSVNLADLSNCPFQSGSFYPPHASYFLPEGTIYGILNSEGNWYYTSDGSPLFLDVFAEDLMPQTTCFKTVEEAEAAGYTLYTEA